MSYGVCVYLYARVVLTDSGTYAAIQYSNYLSGFYDLRRSAERQVDSNQKITCR